VQDVVHYKKTELKAAQPLFFIDRCTLDLSYRVFQSAHYKLN